MGVEILLYSISFFLFVFSGVALALLKKYDLLASSEIEAIARDAVSNAMEIRRGSAPEAIASAVINNLPDAVKRLKATKEQLIEKAKNYQ